MRSKIQQLLARNKGRGRFAVEAIADEATVFLYDMIVDSEADAQWWGGVAAESFVQQIAALEVGTIHLRVNSPGGSVFAGRSMETALRQHKARVIAHVDGLAASAASFVIMGADEIEMSPGAFLMIHKAWTISWGNSDDLRHEAGVLEQIDASLVATYARRTGIDAERVAEMLSAETWIEAADAVKQGFADRVAEEPVKAASAWDLSAYAHAPRIAPAKDIAPEPPLAAPQPDRAALRRATLARLVPA